MTYINTEHKKTEALLMIRLVEECLSCGIANQFSLEALAGLSVSLKRARLLLDTEAETNLITLDKKFEIDEVVFDQDDSDSFTGENFNASPKVNRGRVDFIKNPVNSNNSRQIVKPSRSLASRIEVEKDQREQQIFRSKSQRPVGQMGSEGPRINMSRKRLRAALD